MFDAIGFLETYGIKHARRGKHARPGWVQIECPLCTGHSGMHGGFNLSRGSITVGGVGGIPWRT